MRDFLQRKSLLLTVLCLGLPTIARAHAMPTSMAEDQLWRLWPDGVVAYEFIATPLPADRSTPQRQLPVDAAARRALEEAMRHIQDKTAGAIVFQPSSDHPRRVRFSLMAHSPDVGFCGMASVGYVAAVGSLQITDTPACKTRAVALHELMHTLGFLHENQRFQAIMDRERRPAAQDFYADRRTTVDHDSITYNDGLQGERLDLLKTPSQLLLVRLRHGLEASGRWFQELSRHDVAAILRYYPPDQTLEKQLARAARERPGLRFVRLELGRERCLQTGAQSGEGWRELFVARCDTVSAGQRWAQDAQGALHSLGYPGQCIAKLQLANRPATDGDHAILDACRPGDPLQQWETRGQRLVNRGQPQLQLSYAEEVKNVLVWWERPGLFVDWQRRTAPASRPGGITPGAAAGTDPWRHTLHSVRHAPDKVFRLLNGGRCLSDAGADNAQPREAVRSLRLMVCRPTRSQLWRLEQGRLSSLEQPAYCLDGGPRSGAGAALQRCRLDLPAQQWALQGIQGSREVMISARLNPLLADDYRLLQARPDGQLQIGDATAPRSAVSWQALAETAPTPPPPRIEPAAAPAQTQPAGAGRQQRIALLGGDQPVRGATLCLNVQRERPPGFSADERGVGVAKCVASDAQHWTLHDDGRLSSPAMPGLCLGRNRARLGQELHASYRLRAVRYTGHAALQPCRLDDPTQRWAWRAARYHHQEERGGNSGAQLVLRDAPDLSLIVHGKARGPQLSIGQADIADQFQFFRWQPTRTPGPLAGAFGGVRMLDWAQAGASWERDGPGYIGRGIHMQNRQHFGPLRWSNGRQCLSLRPDGVWRLTLATCQAGRAEQDWRIDAHYRLVNRQQPGLCLRRATRGVVLADCADAQALVHWYLNDSMQLESLDQAPLRLIRRHNGDVMLDDKLYQGLERGWLRN